MTQKKLSKKPSIYAPIEEIEWIEKHQRQFKKLNIHTLWDLLLHLPRRYENRSQITPMSDMVIGSRCLCQGRVLNTQLKRGKKNHVLVVTITDNTEILLLRFFHFNAYRIGQFAVDKFIRCFGEIREHQGQLEMVHPETDFVTDTERTLPNYFTAIYASVEGLPQYRIRHMINLLLDQPYELDSIFEESLTLKQNNNATLLFSDEKNVPATDLDFIVKLTISQAIYAVHRPPLDLSIEQLNEFRTPYHQRLAVEELSAHCLGLLQLKQTAGECLAPAFSAKHLKSIPAVQKLLENLSFEPTDAQWRCVQEVSQSIQKQTPMMRLLQGDVGSGKTLVAVLLLLLVVDEGWKGAFLVPTELLAKQHHKTLSNWLEPLGVEVLLITGSRQSQKLKKANVLRLAEEKPLIVIGTHALFQKSVDFCKLGLLIIDEQHRFGVEQRLQMLQKSQNTETLMAHQLLVSATPIPRTLAMGFYGDLEQSIIDTMPPGRMSIDTVAFSNERLPELIMKIGEQCQKNRQVYWVCPIIDESEKLNLSSVSQRYQELCQQLPEVSVGLIHGKMSEQDKNTVMQKFRSGDLQLLVATTVIEVGVDVPNASIMIIENAERMGLAQLHQLRGRVGRGSVKSECLLLYQAPLSQRASQRLDFLRKINDGFVLAEKDLMMRGAGEIIGTRQSGGINFKVVDFSRDGKLIGVAKQVARHLLEDSNRGQAFLKRWGFDQSELGRV